MATPKTHAGSNFKQDKLWSDAIRRAVHREAEKGKPTKRLEVLADKLVQAGMQGDISAMKEIGDRLDGKPSQQTQLTSEPGGLVVNLVHFDRPPE